MQTSQFTKIACIGSGLIGVGWTVNFIVKGYSVNLYDINKPQLETAAKLIQRNLEFLVAKEVLTQEGAAEAASRIFYYTDLAEAVKDVQFVQEAGPERYDVKQSILAEVEKHVSDEVVFASSTSGLLLTEIAKHAKHPERCLGAHPYNPVHLIPLVEITKGDKTSEKYVNLACEFYQQLGKEPIVLKKEALGFIANRLQVALYREAVELVMRGVCTVEEVDKAALFGPGLRFGILGPNLIFQLGGGAHGITGILTHIGPSVEMWWADMADWKRFPEGWIEMAQVGVDKAMANRDKQIGNTNEEVSRYRDDMLVEVLKLHKKL
ncbi:3-hydroxyacyl-CoA dehydrogenase [Anaerosporomusa subterranea]|uniref:3-hydroxyacyl-CoA dehydrogenase n=1 Tax=Anaerosporomusa subterranea TaxID=1794912 RepID=A0A154BR91_ANASB|nr:3-hydroxyacyl-CoA dehydrogenase family protein [Anaerosporomusa subterranea]KYZ76456.1 3-hydroxyacyl-CoA dehydrogenase [Anaerosporomusa subterranea]